MKKDKTKKIKRIKTVFVFLIIAVIIVLTTATALLFASGGDIELNPEALRRTGSRITVVDALGEKMDTNALGNEYCTYSEISENVIDAFVAMEDKRFFSHNGLDYKRIAAAIISNIKAGKIKEGGSTITQQLVKNTHLTREKTVKRKLEEARLARELERNYSKEQILEWYLNAIYFGSGVYGIKGASVSFFDKQPSELTIKESAILAGIVKNPSAYSPVNHPEAAGARAELVLSAMLKTEKITTTEYETALSETPSIIPTDKSSNRLTPYAEAAIEEAAEILGLSKTDLVYDGYTIKTYLDQDAQDAVFSRFDKTAYFPVNEAGNAPSVSVLLADRETCGVSAYYSNQPYSVFATKRQPASAIKPFTVYAPALEYGIISAVTPILDEQFEIDGYSPKNYSDVFHGYVSARTALAHSYNVPAVKVMSYVGIPRALSVAENFGIEFSEQDGNYAVALGGMTDGVSLVTIAGAYTALSNGGSCCPLSFVSEILDPAGNVVYSRIPQYSYAVSDDTAYVITDILRESTKDGTSSKLSALPFEIAAKTGTSSERRDAWSVSYTTAHTLAVWYGNVSNAEDTALSAEITGGSYPTLLARDIYGLIYAESTPQPFDMPESVAKLAIDREFLTENQRVLLAPDGAEPSEVVYEIFSRRFAPTEYAPQKQLSIDDFSVSVRDGKVKVSFLAREGLRYEIFRKPFASRTETVHTGTVQGNEAYTDERPPRFTPTEYSVVIYRHDGSVAEVKRKTVFIL